MGATKSLKDKAEATAALLDVKDPEWPKKIDKEKLDMHDRKLCVIGQTRGDFFEANLLDLGYPGLPGCEERGRRLCWAFEHGLSADPNANAATQHRQFSELIPIWHGLVGERLAA